MNIQEFRAKYPQYNDLSDEQLARGLHRKYYADMPYEVFAGKFGLNKPSLSPLTDEQRQTAENLRKQTMPEVSGWDIAREGLKGFGEGAVVGATRPLNGATLGAFDWADRNLLGGNVSAFKNDVDSAATSAGLGALNKTAQFGLDLAGNMLGAGGALAKGATKLGLKGIKQAVPLGAAEGLAYGATGTDSADDLGGNLALGAATGALGGAVIHGGLSGLGRLKDSATAGLKGGLTNVVSNPKATKLMNKGLKFGSDEFREEFLNKAYPAARQINSETAGMVNNSLTRRINVPETVAKQKAKYGQYMDEHAADEVLDFSPRDYLSDIVPESGYNPSLGRTQKEYADLLKNRAKKAKVNLYGDINHFLKEGRKPYVRTLKNTLEKPDISYTQNKDGTVKDYFAKKYTNNQTGEPFFDFTYTKNGDVYSKFNTNSNYLANQFKKPVENLSFNGLNSGNQQGISPLPEYMFNVAQNGAVVNPELTNISSLYEGLTPFQANTLDKAVKSGLSKTNQKAGSLESVNKIKQELNDAITNSQTVNPNNRLSSADTSDTVEIRKVKKIFDDVLGAALKGKDKSYRKAKRLEEAYNLGRRYNPNGAGNDDLIPSLTPLENNAFAQGLFKKMTNNPLTGENLAKSAVKYENVLADVLPQNTYDTLISGLNNQSARFSRLNKLGNLAESKLSLPEAEKVFLREQNENNGARVGAILDWGYGKLRGKALERAARKLLDPNYVGKAPVQIDPRLAAGLSAEAFAALTKQKRR